MIILFYCSGQDIKSGLSAKVWERRCRAVGLLVVKIARTPQIMRKNAEHISTRFNTALIHECCLVLLLSSI